jgi:hypothetical protein
MAAGARGGAVPSKPALPRRSKHSANRPEERPERRHVAGLSRFSTVRLDWFGLRMSRSVWSAPYSGAFLLRGCRPSPKCRDTD